MNELAIMEVAHRFVAEHASGLGHELESVERVEGHPSLWTVIGRWRSLSNGSLDAAPIVVFVDEQTLAARFLDFETDVLGNQLR